MLISLYATNFILIQGLQIEFKQGLNVLTGESGAGKSVILKAIETCLGAPFYKTFQLDKREHTVLSLVIKCTKSSEELKQLLNCSAISETEIIIRRVLSASGQVRSFINDMPVSSLLLKKIQPLVFETYRQDQKQLLFNSDYQLALVDDFHGHEEDLEAFKRVYREFRRTEQQLNQLLADGKKLEQRKDRLSFEVSEIEKIAPQPDEYSRLKEQRKIAKNQMLINSLSQKVTNSLYEAEGSIHTRLAEAIDDLTQLARFFPELSNIPTKLYDSLYLIADVVEQIQFRQSGDNPVDIDDIENRMKELESLFRKYGRNEEEVICYMQSAKANLLELENSEQTGKKLKEKHKELAKKLTELAGILSRRRRKAAGSISELVEKELHNMAMKQARFRVDIKKQSSICHFSSTGADTVSFLYAPHYNIEPLALQKIASGGELSRVALGVKSVFRRTRNTPVSLFDEIDTGIGGEVAHTVARLLYAMSKEAQTIVVTHLHQIARQADHHICIEKIERKGLPEIVARVLSDKEKEEELVRMLGGRESLEDIDQLDYC